MAGGLLFLVIGDLGDWVIEGWSTGWPEMRAVGHIDYLGVLQDQLPGPSERGLVVGEYHYSLSDSSCHKQLRSCMQSHL